MASQLPPQSTEPLGDFLLEGLDSPYTLYGAADAAELVPPEDLWVSTPATGAGEAADDPWQDGQPLTRRLAVLAATPVAAATQHTTPPPRDA